MIPGSFAKSGLRLLELLILIQKALDQGVLS